MFVTTKAFERRADLGGGFRGVVAIYDHDRGNLLERLESPVSESLADAGGWALQTAWNKIGGRSFQIGHYRGDRYKKNYWVKS